MTTPSDLEIARRATVRPIVDVAGEYGLEPGALIAFGETKAKVHLDAQCRLAGNGNDKYVDVTAITPTPLGEGKTTTVVGLSRGWGRWGTRRSPVSVSRAWDRPLGSRVVPPEVATARLFRWTSSIFTSR